ncbi:MAG: phenylalanine--tRNA ligase subunit beta, partial [Clostridiales bacterium]|nr:phenylalanine--tRNA ligase subunit beta [Clostridiales bacterium]
MLCSLDELGLTINDFPYAIEDGIFILSDDPELKSSIQIGQDIKEAIGLNDIKVEFEITSNRPDCLSVLGLAREASATFDTPVNMPNPQVSGSGGDINSHIGIEIENKELCPRYIAKVVKNVKIAPSPIWMRERLRASGVRPINNLVDITNYVMLEYGQPLHAFDSRYVDGAKIIIRNAKKGEKIMTLDGVERQLSADMLVIADENKPIAVAGVMGGEFSGVMEDTTTVIFESASFNGASVRNTAKRLGMRTDASARFEKGIDASTTLPAILRACELIEMLDAGDVVDGIIDRDFSDKAQKRIPLDAEFINSFLGIKISEQEMIDILRKLDFEFSDGDVIVPSIRIDVESDADLAEEIARIYGYDNIPTTQPRGLAQAKLTNEQKYQKKLSNIMLGIGCNEIVTYSFISPKAYDRINLPDSSKKRSSVTISNPLGEDTSVMRTTTIASMLDVLSRNYNNRNKNARLFEIATIYIPNEDRSKLPDEREQLTIGIYEENADFFTLKGIIESALSEMGLTECDFSSCSNNPTFHTGRCAIITKDGVEIGTFGEVHPTVLENFDIGTKAYVAELDIATMMEFSAGEKSYKPLPKFPAITRDLSLICDDGIPVAEIEKAIKKGAGNLLENIELFDLYKGEQIEKGKKSVSYSLTLRSHDSTLTDERADKAVKLVLKELGSIGAVIRA